jgi:heme-degrading monooxygenase HmoA
MDTDVYVVWETWLKPEYADDGYDITKAIWRDMLKFKGYIGHFLLRDQDDAGHLLLVSRWESRQDADESKRQYSSNQKVADLQPLLSKERGRTIYDLREMNNFVIDKHE